jgi:hypothetical protein
MSNDDIRIEAFRALIEKTTTNSKPVTLGMAYNHGKYRSTTIHNSGNIVRVKK